MTAGVSSLVIRSVTNLWPWWPAYGARCLVNLVITRKGDQARDRPGSLTADVCGGEGGPNPWRPRQRDRAGLLFLRRRPRFNGSSRS